MFASCILEPIPPTGYLLILRDCILIINPPTEEIAYSTLETYTKPTSIIITKPSLLHIAQKTQKDLHTIISPLPTQVEIQNIYPIDQEIPITKNTSIYLLNPPPITKNKAHYTLITTKTLTILSSTRPTYIQNPPKVDIILTDINTYTTATKNATHPNEIPKYLGSDAQWCFILNKEDKIKQQYIHINTKKYLIQRHLTQINIKEIKEK